MKMGTGSCNGTFGELVQGILDGRPFLITLPITGLRSEAVFIPDPAMSEMKVADSKVKALKAGQLLLEQFGLKVGGHLKIRSNIPIGKGMASSSADIVAALKAIANSCSLPLTNDIISAAAAQIEPTDGVMYEEVVAYDHIHGKLIESLGVLPPFILVGIDIGGTVDTITWNQVEKAYDLHDQNEFLEAYGLVKQGFRENHFSFICKAATMSARVNQTRLAKPFFHEFEKLAHACQGGVVVAHSGTVAGILINQQRPNLQEVFLHLIDIMSVIGKSLGATPFFYCSQEKTFRLINEMVTSKDKQCQKGG